MASFRFVMCVVVAIIAVMVHAEEDSRSARRFSATDEESGTRFKLSDRVRFLERRMINKAYLEWMYSQYVGATCVTVPVQRTVPLKGGWTYLYGECVDDRCSSTKNDQQEEVASWDENNAGYYALYGLKPDTDYKVWVQYKKAKGEKDNQINPIDKQDSQTFRTEAESDKRREFAYCEKACRSNPCGDKVCRPTKGDKYTCEEAGSNGKRALFKLLQRFLSENDFKSDFKSNFKSDFKSPFKSNFKAP